MVGQATVRTLISKVTEQIAHRTEIQSYRHRDNGYILPGMISQENENEKAERDGH